MIYRVLRENEICDKGLGEGIYSKTFTMENYKNRTLSDALDNITAHISKGNNYKTEFISCSKNLCIDLEKYASEQLNLRPYLAVISNHDNSIIQSDEFDLYVEKLNLIRSINEQCKNMANEEHVNEVKKDAFLEKIIADSQQYKENIITRRFLKIDEFDYLYPEIILKENIGKIKQSNINKLVIDASKNIYNDSVYGFFFNNEMICNRTGFTKTSYNQRESGTAKNSSELVVLNYISIEDMKILNPLQYDIIYALCMNHTFMFGNISPKIYEQVDIFSEENYRIIQNELESELEHLLFEKMYIERKPIYEIVTTIQGYKNVIALKKNILDKCVRLLNKYFKEQYYGRYFPTIEENINLSKSPVVEVKEGKILRKVR